PENTQHQLEFEARGHDRVVIVAFMVGGTAGNGDSVPGTVYINEQRALSSLVGGSGTHTAGTNRSVRIQVFKNVRVGPNRITWSFSSGTGVNYTAIAIALEGAANSDVVMMAETENGTS